RDFHVTGVQTCALPIWILAYSPLERGLLTGKIKENHHFNDGDHRAGLPFYQKENLRKVNQFLGSIEHIAKDKNASLGQLALAWKIGRASCRERVDMRAR